MNPDTKPESTQSTLLSLSSLCVTLSGLDKSPRTQNVPLTDSFRLHQKHCALRGGLMGIKGYSPWFLESLKPADKS